MAWKLRLQLGNSDNGRVNMPAQEVQQQAATLARLKSNWSLISLLYFVGIFLLASYLNSKWESGLVLMWGGVAGLAALYVLRLLRANLASNHPPDNDQLYASLGYGTYLSLFRGWLLALLAGFLLIPWPSGWLGWTPALLYILAGILDLFDGYLARRTHHTTALGEFLDIELDSFGVLIAVAVAIHWGQWPIWFAVIGLARPLFIWGLNLRRRRKRPIRPLPANNFRRVLAGLQMGFIAVALWPIVPAKWATVVGLAFAIPFTLNFLLDWLIASTLIDVESEWYKRMHRTLHSFFTDPVALAARLIVVLALAMLLYDTATHFSQVGQALVSIGFPAGIGVVALFALLELLGIPLMALGIAPRLVAIVLFVPAGFSLIAGISQFACLAVIFGAIAILLFGPGPYTLWQPEAKLFQQRLGDAAADA